MKCVRGKFGEKCWQWPQLAPIASRNCSNVFRFADSRAVTQIGNEQGWGLVQYGGQELCRNYQLREHLKVQWCWQKMVINLMSCVVSHIFGNIFCHGCWGRNDQEDRPLTTHLATWRWIQGGKCHKQGRVLSPDCRKCGHSVPEIAGGALKCTMERCKFFICQNEYHVYFFFAIFHGSSF